MNFLHWSGIVMFCTLPFFDSGRLLLGGQVQAVMMFLLGHVLRFFQELGEAATEKNQKERKLVNILPG